MFIDKVVIALLSPLGTSLVLAILALSCSRLHLKKSAMGLFLFALVWFWVWSTPVVSHYLRASIESQYPVRDMKQLPTAHAIIVLGGGMRPPEQFEQLPDLTDGADRVWYAARLYRAGKAPLIVVSGGSDRATSATSEAESMRLFLADLNVPGRAVLLEDTSRNTRQNAEFCARILKKKNIRQILLVTSALHMPRAEALFKAQGFYVIPAPTDHEARHRFTSVDWLPDANALDGSARAMKEIVGRVFNR